MNDCFVYVSQIPRYGTSGQNKFEKGFIGGLLKTRIGKRRLDIKIFSAAIAGEIPEDARLVLIPLIRKSYSGYIFHQFRLLFSLGTFLWSQRKKNVYMFIRYHDAMLAPLILSFLFNIRLTMRTGPVLPNLAACNKKPGAVIYHCIKWVLGLFFLKASSIITVTETIKRWVVETYNLNPEKIVVVPNAADTTLFFPEDSNRGKWNLPENEFVFGYVGAIYEEQGLSTIVQALGLLKKNREKVPTLFIVGDGDYGDTLQSMSKELGVADRIIWAGNIPHEEVRSAINACDMMLAPFQKKDLEVKGSSALKLWEYLACDKPVLASEFKDHQFLEKQNLGKMVEPDNIKLWAEALAQEAKSKNFSLQGRGEKFIAKEHSYDFVVEKFISISLGQKMI